MANINLWDYCHIDTIADPYIIFVAKFLTETGIRPSDLIRISKHKLSYIEGIIKFNQQKTNIPITIRLSGSMLEQSRFWHRRRGNFVTNFRNIKIMRREIMKVIHPLFFIKNGYNSLYYFRYLFVLGMMKNGVPEHTMSRKLGHTDRATVQDYINKANQIILAKKEKE